MRDHTTLRAFVLADEVALFPYRETKQFPKDEIDGLTSQMRRAAVSVPSHIVEGCARESQVEFLRFLEIAFSSLRKLHDQFGLSKRLGYLRDNNDIDCELKLVEIRRVTAFFTQA